MFWRERWRRDGQERTAPPSGQEAEPGVAAEKSKWDRGEGREGEARGQGVPKTLLFILMVPLKR